MFGGVDAGCHFGRLCSIVHRWRTLQFCQDSARRVESSRRSILGLVHEGDCLEVEMPSAELQAQTDRQRLVGQQVFIVGIRSVGAL